MSRGYSRSSAFGAREGVAVGGRWALGKERSFQVGNQRPVKYHGLLKEDGSPERVAELDKLREQSAIKVPVYRGQPAFETLDKKAMKEALKKNKEELDWRQKKDSKFYGGAGMFHFAAGLDHAIDYAEEDGGVMEGVLLSKSLLDLRSLNSEPVGYRVLFEHETKPSPLDTEFRKRRDDETGWDYALAASEKFDDNGVYSVMWQNDDDKGFRLSRVEENIRVARYIDQAVKTIADAYQAKFGKPMPQDFYRDKRSKDEYHEKKQDELLKRDDYAALRSEIWHNPRFTKAPYAYILLQTTPFKNIMKKAGFDAVAYNDIIHHGENHESFAVLSPKQFKAYAGDKKVNLKSDNMFDAD